MRRPPDPPGLLQAPHPLAWWDSKRAHTGGHPAFTHKINPRERRQPRRRPGTPAVPASSAAEVPITSATHPTRAPAPDDAVQWFPWRSWRTRSICRATQGAGERSPRQSPPGFFRPPTPSVAEVFTHARRKGLAVQQQDTRASVNRQFWRKRPKNGELLPFSYPACPATGCHGRSPRNGPGQGPPWRALPTREGLDHDRCPRAEHRCASPPNTPGLLQAPHPYCNSVGLHASRGTPRLRRAPGRRAED